ncbi:MAG: GNAT family N-acetyltransferase [candidate division Zixibacteria bacterium]|nr:GNAT family N-acetyltransferase [candidate division Zixibacteria bacterium]
MVSISLQSNKSLKDKLKYLYSGFRYYWDRFLQKIYFKGYFVVFKSPLEMRVPPLRRVNIDLDFKVVGPENFDDLRGLAPPWKIRAFKKRLKKGCLATIGYSKGVPVSYCWFAEDSGKIEDFDYWLPPGEIYAFDAWVNPTFRGRGIAYYNFKFIFEFFKTRGFHTYLGIVQSWNRTMLRMYYKVKIDYYGILKHQCILGFRKSYIIPPGEEENEVERKYLSKARLPLPERDVKFRVIESEDRLDDIKPEWERLFEQNGNNDSIMSYGCFKKWQNGQKPRPDLFVIIGQQQDTIKSIFPFRIRKGLRHKDNGSPKAAENARVIEFIGEDTGSRDFLLEGDKPQLIVSMLDLLYTPLSDKWDMVDLTGIDSNSENYQSLVNVLYERRYDFVVSPDNSIRIFNRNRLGKRLHSSFSAKHPPSKFIDK